MTTPENLRNAKANPKWVQDQSDSIHILSKRKSQVWKDIYLHNTKLL